MAEEQKKILPINYTNRDFKSIREDLLDMAERFYPDTFQDFSEASFGAIVLDAAAYVGDQLSFYLDYNINETFLDTAFQFNNILRHGQVLGYKSQGRPSTYGLVTLYVIVPASSTAIGPDESYLPILRRGARFTTSSGLNFMLTENIDFSNPQNEVAIARNDASTGAPTHYAVRAYGNVVSGLMQQERIAVGPFERFRAVTILAANVSEIISVFDTEGHQYYEVDYMAQDIVYKEIANNNFKNDNVPSIIKPFLVSRKFIVQYQDDRATLQFGSGNPAASNVIAEPQKVALDIYGKTYTTDKTFDPTKLTNNHNYGIVPSDTTLTIVYRVTNPTNSNSAVGSLRNVASRAFDYKNRSSLSNVTVQEINESLEVFNEKPIVGDTSFLTSEELKRRVFDTFPTQNRAVTQADYENLVYRMPVKFGSIKRVSVQRDPDSQKRNLNMYVISEDKFGKLTATNDAIKNNIKTWMNNYRMLSDTIDLLDPYILNIGIEFIIKPHASINKFVALDNAVKAVRSRYTNTYYIGEQFSISDVYSYLKEVPGVLDVLKVKIVSKTTSEYSSANITINENLSPEGNYLIVPKNAIVEIKYPAVDIKGKVR
tara:strand:+ start:9782 stop:11578 length:1797 start_codon:yes stop_codon:yes gene_type:complete